MPRRGKGINTQVAEDGSFPAQGVVDGASVHLQILTESMTNLFTLVLYYHGSEAAHRMLETLHATIHLREAMLKPSAPTIINPNTQEEEGSK